MRKNRVTWTGATALALMAMYCGLAATQAPQSGKSVASIQYGGSNRDTSYRLPQRVVKGTVLDQHGVAVPNTTVYLKDLQSKDLRTMLPAKDGTYLFGGLPLSHDYEVWAQLGKEKSKVQQVSSFIASMEVTAALHVTTQAATPPIAPAK